MGIFSSEDGYFKTTPDFGLSVNRSTTDGGVNVSNISGYVIPVLNIDSPSSGSCLGVNGNRRLSDAICFVEWFYGNPYLLFQAKPLLVVEVF